ncbi:site-2 protease family protein [Fodinicola acaciae]|uniref:site-2 protease family protein n=1 Tax=Fodinicola acaciae TaxID=2681555 RepID=UPI0013D82761|nr:site-2 protease family protein [Fodinicola acaciae]
MKATISIGRWAGIPLRAHWTVLVTAVLVAWILASSALPAAVAGYPVTAYWTAGLLAAAAFIFSLLAHEIAHAATARHHGGRVRSITLWLLGGVTEIRDEPASPGSDLLIAAAGPLTSLAAAVVFAASAFVAAAAHLPAIVLVTLFWLAASNLILAVFNLLPGAPLDGGRVLRAIVWKVTGDRDRAEAVAAGAGRILGLAMIAFGLTGAFLSGWLGGLWLAAVGWFLVVAASAERNLPVVRKLRDITANDVMSSRPVVVPAWWTVDAFVDRLAGSGLGHRTFPVVDFDGRPVGLVSLGDLVAGQRVRRPDLCVRDIARPLGAGHSVPSGEALSDVTQSGVLRDPADAVLVVDDGRLVGILTAADLSRAVQLVQLGKRPAHPNPADQPTPRELSGKE